jgi:hypothetical protein
MQHSAMARAWMLSSHAQAILMNKAMQRLIHSQVRRPVLLANSLLAKIIDEMVG